MTIVAEEEMRRGRRIIGHFVTFDDGSIAFLARKKQAHVIRGTQGTISSAVTAGEAAWGIDESTLNAVRIRQVENVGIRVVETGDLYLARLADFYDLKKARIRQTESEWGRGQRQRVLPFSQFEHRSGRVAVDKRRIVSVAAAA